MVRQGLACFLAAGNFITSTSAVATCYRNFDKQNASTIYTPCNALASFSMCYRTQPTNGLPPDQKCLPNGLSLYFHDSSGYSYWRNGCTDPTWESPYCLNAFNICNHDDSGNAEVSPCGDSSSMTYCCGKNNTGCCNSDSAITIAAVLGPSSTTPLLVSLPTSSLAVVSTIATISTIAAISTLAVVSTPIATHVSSDTCGISTATKVGMGTAAAVGWIAFIVLIFWVSAEGSRRRRKRDPRSFGGDNSGYRMGGNMVYEADTMALKKARTEPIELS